MVSMVHPYEVQCNHCTLQLYVILLQYFLGFRSQDYFDRKWHKVRSKSTKLIYYNQVKEYVNYRFEPFLNLSDSEEKKCLIT